MIAGVGEEELIGRRAALMGLGYPANDWTDGRVVAATGGRLLPMLKGWKEPDLRDWAELHESLPEVAGAILAAATDRWYEVGRLHRLAARIRGDVNPPGIEIEMRALAGAGGYLYCRSAIIPMLEIRQARIPIIPRHMGILLERIERDVAGRS